MYMKEDQRKIPSRSFCDFDIYLYNVSKSIQRMSFTRHTYGPQRDRIFYKVLLCENWHGMIEGEQAVWTVAGSRACDRVMGGLGCWSHIASVHISISIPTLNPMPMSIIYLTKRRYYIIIVRWKCVCIYICTLSHPTHIYHGLEIHHWKGLPDQECWPREFLSGKWTRGPRSKVIAHWVNQLFSIFLAFFFFQFFFTTYNNSYQISSWSSPHDDDDASNVFHVPFP